MKPTLLLTLISSLVPALAAADAPGGPGIPHSWAPARKEAVGTAYEALSAGEAPESPLWFTVAEGIVTETFYPTIDQAQNGDLQLLVVNREQGFFSEQRRDVSARVTYSGDGSAVETVGLDRQKTYELRQSIVTDPEHPALRLRVRLRFTEPSRHRATEIYVLWKPALRNAGGSVTGQVLKSGELLASSAETMRPRGARSGFARVAAVLRLASGQFGASSAGYVGSSDGWQQLKRDGTLTESWNTAGPGNVALVARVPQEQVERGEFELILAYGPDAESARAQANASAHRGFPEVFADYTAGWTRYLASLDRTKPGDFFRGQLARRSAVTLKMHEDKSNPGAVIASLSKPGIPGGDRAGDGTGGYHLVWPRDLYHAAMGRLAAGDARGALDSLDYLVRTQKPDGSWHQNFWIDGTPYWRGLQMDQVAFPILLAWQLEKRGLLLRDARIDRMLRLAADFIASQGPTTQQDRWEEIGGYIPHVIGTEIAALDRAAFLLRDASYSAAAARFSSLLERWTVVPQGVHGQNYYLRVSPSGHPEIRERITIANGGGEAWADEVLDGGFLELVRHGVRAWDAPEIRSTLAIYDRESSGVASQGHYLRYNRDGYGHHGRGGYWPLLAGERGHYAISEGDFARARHQMAAIERSALPSGMIPEQILAPVAPAGDATANVSPGAATPLAWAHAEAILLYRSLEERSVFDAVDLEIR